ncbi:MAG TPA: ubiquinone biosynthesis regulatory protein kinase UbiB [Methylophilus sp.]
MHWLRFIHIIGVLLWYRLDVFFLQQTHFRGVHRVLNLLLYWRHAPEQRAIRLRLALERLGPIFVKFGQMLSTRRDLLPADVADELTKLQDQVPPFDYAKVEAILEQAFAAPVASIYAQFDTVPVASASVAQVHFATLHSGEQVAVKVLRPGIDRIIHRDIALLRTLAWWVKTLSSEGRRLKPDEMIDEFARHTEHELDLTLEAAQCTQLGRNFSDRRLLVPSIYWDYSHKHVMTMQRMFGTPVRDTATLQAYGINLTTLAHEGVEIFFTQVFRDGFFHADMHPGNIQVVTHGPDKGKFIALDFGIMGSLTPTDQYYLARNFLAFFNRDYRDVAVAHIESGWVPADTNVEALETAVRAICEPIFEKPLKDISFGRTLLSLFQMSRRFGVNIQPQLIMLQKTLLNIEGLGRELDPNIDLWHSAKPFLKRWMSEQIGWRSLLKSAKRELPYVLTHAAEMPRLLEQYLRNQSDVSKQQQHIDALLLSQHKQTTWLKWATLAIIVLVLLQFASLFLLFSH